ncbi:MAG: hypothetical protein OK455_04940 [Thaumarchaeota archaeon]|nr:hypothetical protein [Nitrososphaerota archaeon]
MDPNRPESIADGVIQVLSNPSMARGLAEKARQRVTAYGWGSISERTSKVYEQAVRDVRYE